MWMQFVATLKGLTTAPANLDILEIERNAPVFLLYSLAFSDYHLLSPSLGAVMHHGKRYFPQ